MANNNNNNNNNDDDDDDHPDARSWFESLPPEESAAALSFRDGPLLQSFLELAAATTTTTSSPPLQQQQQVAFDTNDYWKTMSVDKKEWDATFAKQQHQHQQETLAEGGAMNGDVATTAAAAATTTTMAAAPKAADIATTKKEGDSSTSTDKSSSRKLASGATAKGEASQEDANQMNTPGNTNAATATPATTSKTASTPSSSPASSPSVTTSVPSKITNSSQQESNDAEVYRIQDKTTPQRNKEHPTASPATTATLVPVSPEIDNKISAKGTPKPSAVSCVTPPSSSSSHNNNIKAVVTPNAKSVDDNKNSNNSMTPLTKIDATAQEVAEHVCLVLPSAATASDKTKAIASLTTSHSAVPFVTLHPVFGEKHNKDASAVVLLRALDGMLQQLLPDSNSSASFLSPEWFLSAEETWKAQGINKNEKKGRQPSLPSVEKLCRDRLQSLWNTAIEQKAPVLLFLVLLVRMEVAVYLSFHRQHREQQSTVIDSTRLQPAHLTELLELLESLAKPSASLDTTQLSKIISPLVDGGFCSFEIDNKSASVVMNDVKLENLLITPLPVAVKIFSTVQSGNDKALWDHWDKAWRATLQNMRDHAFPPSQHPMTPTHTGKKSAKKSNNEVPAKSKAEIGDLKDEGAEWMDSTTSTNDPATPATPSANNAKNKKRKKRKKKKGKLANNANAPDADPQDKDKDGKPVAEKEQPNISNDTTETKKSSKQQPAERSQPDGNQAKSVATATVKETAADSKVPQTSIISEPTEPIVSDPGTSKPTTALTANEEDVKVLDGDVNSSFDSEKLPSDETASTTKTESSKLDEIEAEDIRKRSDESDLSVSRVHGVGTVVVAPSLIPRTDITGSTGDSDETSGNALSNYDDNFDDWETVEVKGRGNKKKNGRSNALQSSSVANGGKKSKSRTQATRKKQILRKMVKDILSGVLDSVDDEVKRRRQQQVRLSRNAGSVAAPAVAWKGGNRAAGLPEGTKEDITGQDASTTGQAPLAATQKQKQDAQPEQKNGVASATPQSTSPAGKKKTPVSASPAKESKVQGTGADQQTASTIPETVSAVSETRRAPLNDDRNIARNDSSSSEGEENRKQERATIPTHAGKMPSPAPPLPTLLSPGNANSTSSSVASSLEAPHASHTHRHTPSANEDDVGYHLLDVCDRLTRDMHVFMARRATALNTRRQERGALLGALQESVSSLWAGHSHVELYGSCATMLDLPSSDLDVVVCGLDQIMEPTSPTPEKNVNFVGNPTSEKVAKDKSRTDSKKEHHHHSMSQYVPPVQFNADRVVRLAAELEKQPWAVLVKAIPTASVPVIKVLADPSRLPGATPPAIVDEEEWMTKSQTAPNNSAGDLSGGTPMPSDASASQGSSSPYQASMPPTGWRGADVDNGLLKLDITFEGPEHGGIGSTEFSARVVQNVCDETGLAPENTAFVQVLMVVKELLAQRRLNEPFSGGLSSYSLLLLVLSVMCERKVIHEELERVERQRKVVAAGGANSAVAGPSGAQTEKPPKMPKQNGQQDGATLTANSTAGTKNKAKAAQTPKKEGNGARASQGAGKPNPGETSKRNQAGNQSKGGPASKSKTQGNDRGSSQSSAEGAPQEKKSGGNSWASIAMDKNTALANKEAKKDEAQLKRTAQVAKKPSSFADAVARNASKSETQGNSASQSTQAAQRATQTEAGNPSQNPSQAKAAPSKDAKKANKKQGSNNPTKKQESSKTKGQQKKNGAGATTQRDRKIEADEKTSKFNNYSSGPSSETAISSNQSVFPQGFNDVIEVLCTGEATPGKLLMHFLLFYGQHFEGHATAIDISGKHPREIPTHSPLYTHFSPYIQRRSAGVIDPITGIFTVDPIVVYDPLEGAEMNNVARRCFLWGSVKWVFAQSFMTLSSAVEQNTTPAGTPGPGTKEVAKDAKGPAAANSKANAAWSGPYKSSDKVDIFDPTSPLLELLLSF